MVRVPLSGNSGRGTATADKRSAIPELPPPQIWFDGIDINLVHSRTLLSEMPFGLQWTVLNANSTFHSMHLSVNTGFVNAPYSGFKVKPAEAKSAATRRPCQ
jgi:hypothetical protein